MPAHGYGAQTRKAAWLRDDRAHLRSRRLSLLALNPSPADFPLLRPSHRSWAATSLARTSRCRPMAKTRASFALKRTTKGTARGNPHRRRALFRIGNWPTQGAAAGSFAYWGLDVGIFPVGFLCATPPFESASLVANDGAGCLCKRIEAFTPPRDGPKTSRRRPARTRPIAASAPPHEPATAQAARRCSDR